MITFFRFLVKPGVESFFVLGEVYESRCASGASRSLLVKSIYNQNRRFVVFDAADIVCPVGLLSVVNNIDRQNNVCFEPLRKVIYPGDVLDEELLKKPGNYNSLFARS